MSVSLWGNGQTILQVQTFVLTTKFSTTGAPYQACGLSVSITPFATTSKILCMVDARGGSSASGIYWVLQRNGSAIYTGTQNAGSQQTSTGQVYQADPNSGAQYSVVYIDSPATTASTTYQLAIASYNGNIATINRSANDTNASYGWTGASSITVMEISGA